jgi:hypothetical protein
MTMQNSAFSALVAWCEQEHQALRKLLGWMESDMFRAFKRQSVDNAWNDITQLRIVQTKAKIADLETKLAACWHEACPFPSVRKTI